MSRRSSRRNYNERVESQVDEELEVEDDMDNEEQEITRCVCGNDDLNADGINKVLVALLLSEYQIKIDQGLFIQCDKCSVWQHGYCVGLFINEDVPDKYWCEQCKPDLHLMVSEVNDRFRTLYRPVNDKRKKLMIENEKYNKRKLTRKDRRNYDYDEQLQKALRESAKESAGGKKDDRSRHESNDSDENSNNIKDEDENPGDNDEDNENPNHNDDPAKPKDPSKDDSNSGDDKKAKSVSESKDMTEATEAGEEEGEVEGEEEDDTDTKKDVKRKTIKRAKKREGTRGKPKKAKTNNDGPSYSKEELINQPSKPRFVNDKSSIYELRKRISAILEWLSRSQLELEEEKSKKLPMDTNGDLINNFNENLGSMQTLTGQILEWEEKFGKYAP